MSHRGPEDISTQTAKCTDSNDGKISETICKQFNISLPVEEMTTRDEVVELRCLVVKLQRELVSISAALCEVLDYVREQSEEKSEPVGCGFSCTNNSFTLG